jgi:hypothetical protein
LPQQSNAVSPATVRAAAVQPYARRHEFQLETGTGTYAAEGVQTNTKVEWIGSHSMTVAKLDGEPNIRNSTYECAVTSHPGAICYWEFAFQDILADATWEGNFLMEVDIVYACHFFDRMVVADSSLESQEVRLCETRTAVRSKPEDAYETKQARPLLLQPVTPSTPVDARPPAGWTLVRKVASLK